MQKKQLDTYVRKAKDSNKTKEISKETYRKDNSRSGTGQQTQLKELKKEDKKNVSSLRDTVGFVTFCTLNKTINQCIRGKTKEWNKTHEKKLTQLFKEKVSSSERVPPTNIVHNLRQRKNKFFHMDWITTS